MKIRKAEEKNRRRIFELLNSESAMREEEEIGYDKGCAEEYIKGKSLETF
jgi:hypothetical protein